MSLAITATLLNETMQPVTTIASTFVATHAQHIELADKVAEDGCAVAGHLASRPTSVARRVSRSKRPVKNASSGRRFRIFDYHVTV